MMNLSVIIPSRNEEFLQRTIDDILQNIKGNTEIIAVLDGYWPDPPIQDHPRVTLIHHSKPIGQRAATNEGVKFSNAKYIMKADAHCAFDEGFDIKLMADCEPDWTVIPRMYTLDAFHWVCLNCGKEYAQGPPKIDICQKCEKDPSEYERKIVWKNNRHKRTDFMWFDTELRVHYFDSNALRNYGDDIEVLKARYSHKRRYKDDGDIVDIMCGVGACWLQEKQRYLDLGGLDEGHGSWGQVGVEVAMKAWLSGGRQVVNRKTWFAHMFRTQDGFSWPYDNPGSAQEKARKYSKNLWFNEKLAGQKKDLKWLVSEKFGPLPGWDKGVFENHPVNNMIGLVLNHPAEIKPVINTPNNLTKGIVYYTDNRCEERILQVVRNQLKRVCNGNKIISVSQFPIDFGNKNIVLPLQRSVLTMFKQILAGLEAIDTDIVFLCEHDVIYHPSHFKFTPSRADVYYYNENVWKIDANTGQSLFYHTKQTSGLCAYRELLLEHYKKRVDRVEKEGFSRKMGFEPGCHFSPRGVDNHKAEKYWANHPNLDIRHKNNLTSNRFRKDQFRSEKSIIGWRLLDEVPFWVVIKGRFDEFLCEVNNYE